MRISDNPLKLFNNAVTKKYHISSLMEQMHLHGLIGVFFVINISSFIYYFNFYASSTHQSNIFSELAPPKIGHVRLKDSRGKTQGIYDLKIRHTNEII